MSTRRVLVGAEPPPSMRRQCELLGVNRSSLSYQPVEPDAETLALMRRMDALHLQYPFAGSRMLMHLLKSEGVVVNRKRVVRLMHEMDLVSLAPWRKPQTSEAAPEHPRFCYLLRNLRIERPNQVWASDVTYIPMAHGFLYLVAVIDWVSRMVLSWRLSNTLDPGFCVEALTEALDRFGRPEIFNTDQGAQFTATAHTELLRQHGIAISMDGKGRYIDNIFVERLWRSLKYEEVYLRPYDGGDEARAGIGCYFTFFNHRRPHAALGYQTPAQVHHGLSERREVA